MAKRQQRKRAAGRWRKRRYEGIEKRKRNAAREREESAERVKAASETVARRKRQDEVPLRDKRGRVNHLRHTAYKMDNGAGRKLFYDQLMAKAKTDAEARAIRDMFLDARRVSDACAGDASQGGNG